MTGSTAAADGRASSDAREQLVARWSARIARARELAGLHPAAAELLEFRAAVAEFQRSLADTGAEPPPLRQVTPALDTLIGFVPDLLTIVARAAPAALANVARTSLALDGDAWHSAVAECWTSGDNFDDGADPPRAFVVEALVQPWAERSALLFGAPSESASAEPQVARCPACHGTPVVAVLRDAAQGARRALVCGLCFTEWPWPRIVCPACGERTFTALPVYSTPDFPAARVDACDTCRTFIQTIDLTKDARAIPEIDELAGVPLEIWAREQGYHKLRRNLLRD